MSEIYTNFPTAFDNKLYLQEQVTAFQQRLDESPDSQAIIEFGGKPFGDHHAGRVLPGYDPDSKASILSRLSSEADASIVMVVNARDVLEAPYGRTSHGRIRGDSGLRYDHETVRLIEEAVTGKEIPIDSVVMAVTPHNYDEIAAEKIDEFATNLQDKTGLILRNHYEVPDYPDPESVVNAKYIFSQNDRLTPETNRPLVLVSPGGGSGKFGVALSEAYHTLEDGKQVNFIKFETFPVFSLPPMHPTNMAFQAATADLGNEVIAGADGRTTYDKDDQNYKLIRRLGQMFDGHGDNLAKITSPFDFSINVIERAIVDDHIVGIAGLHEINRRLQRYIAEHRNGDERLSTVEGAARCLGHAIGSNYVTL